MSEEHLWAAVSASGIKIRQHYTDPQQGWLATTRWGQVGPFPSREQALGAAIRFLVDRVVALEREHEQHEARSRLDRFNPLDFL